MGAAAGAAAAGSTAQEVPAVIVFDREGGLTQRDLRAIGRLGVGLNRLEVTGATRAIDAFTADSSESLGDVAKNVRGVGPLSRDGEAALVVLAINAADPGAVKHGVAEIRAYLAGHPIPGVRAYVTGPAGIAADLDRLAAEAGQTLLIATVSLVLILLLVVYRAPLLAVLPLLAVGAAYMVATGIAYLLIKAGWITVNTEGTFLLLVLVFGAGTDYSLLLVHRYREELQRGRPAPEALPLAVRESAPALASSGGHGDRRDARPPRRRARIDPLARADPGDRGRGDAALRLHPPPRLALGPRRARLLGRPGPRSAAAGRAPAGSRSPASFAVARSPSSSSFPPASSSWPSATSPITARSASAKARPARPTRAAAPRSSTSTSRRASLRR